MNQQQTTHIVTRSQIVTVKNHLDQCEGVHHLIKLVSLGLTFFFRPWQYQTYWQQSKSSCINLVIDNIKIIDHTKKFNMLLFKEAIKINRIKPALNTGFKCIKRIAIASRYCQKCIILM